MAAAGFHVTVIWQTVIKVGKKIGVAKKILSC
jgi:hypothetical protein